MWFQQSPTLRTRIIRVFGLLVIGPAVLLAVFSGLFLHLGMQSWFNQKVQTAIRESQAVAQAYLEEHQEVIKQNVRMIARDLQSNLAETGPTEAILDGFLAIQSDLRSLDEAVVVTENGQVVGRSPFSFSLEFEGTPFNLQRARENLVIYPNRQRDRVIAMTQINSPQGLYLIVSRRVDQKVLERISATQKAVNAYENLLEERIRFSWQFTGLFVLFTAIILLLAVWRGIVFSKQFLNPIQRLIQAAQSIRKGQFQTRVSIDLAPKIGELETMAHAFNQMVDEIGHQQTELLAAHTELERRHQFTENVLTGVSAGVLGLDGNGIVHLANQRAFELLKRDSAKILGHPVSTIMPELLPLLETTPLPFETQILWRTSRTFRVHATGHLKSPSENQEKVITFEDITDFLLIQRQAAWSDVARRIAHEIKNPLTPIQLSAERLRRRYLPQITRDPSSFQKCIETITRQVEVLGRIISEFSNFARTPKPSMILTDLKELAENVFLLHKNAYPHIRWDLEKTDKILWVCDPQLLTQLLTNLLKNAVESVQNFLQKTPAHIRLSLLRSEDGVILEVSDNGMGFFEEQLDSVTKPYFTTKEKGTGLGLAIVKKIVEDHGGSLVLSSPKGVGASVKVILKSSSPSKQETHKKEND